MGRVISEMAASREDIAVAAGVDLIVKRNYDYPVFAALGDCDVDCDVIVDFTHPSQLTPLLKYALGKKLPAVIATTGISQAQIKEIEEASKQISIFFSANMSLGVNLIVELAKKAAAVLGSDFDVEIIEQHHNQKIDAPSGTALMLADGISKALPYEPNYVFDRHSKRQKREKNEIGIHSIRGGSIVGDHSVVFAGRDEVVTISHSAYSKEVFATGAISAALFIVSQKNGLYNMADLVL